MFWVAAEFFCPGNAKIRCHFAADVLYYCTREGVGFRPELLYFPIS